MTASDFTSYCVTAPVDPRLPVAAGTRSAELQRQFRQVRAGHNFITNADHYGSDTEVFNGFDIALNGRFGKRGTVAGGVSTGRTVTDICAFSNLPQLTPLTPTLDAPFNQATSGYAAANLPRNPAFCHAVTPWSAQTQVKLNAVYPLPLNFQVSGTFQNLPGFPDFANITASTPTRKSPRRSAATSRRARPVGLTRPVLLPQTMFEDRINQVDLRFTKIVQVGQSRLKANLDVPIVSIQVRFSASTLHLARHGCGRRQLWGPGCSKSAGKSISKSDDPVRLEFARPGCFRFLLETF